MADINLNFGSDDLKKLDKILQDLLRAAKSLESTMKKTGKTLENDLRQSKRYATATKKLVTEKKKLTAVEKEQLRLENREATLKARLSLATSQQAQSVKKLEKQLRDVNTQLRTGGKNTNAWGKALGSFQFKFNALGNIAANVTSKITMAINRSLRDAIRIVKNFDQAMADVKAITGASGKEFEALSKSAQDLGRTTRFTATEVAKLQKEYGKLGFTTKEILDAQAATLALASATNTELPRAAEVVGITIKQFGLGAEESQRVVDVMAKSFSTSALDMEKFAESMKMVGPIASKAGYTLEQTTARLAQLADAGIQGTMGGTALRQIFLEMAKGGKDLGERLKALSMEELGLAEATQEVQKRAAAALLVLVDSVDTVDDYTESLNKAAGASQEMADIQLDTLAGSLDLVKSAWEGMVLAMLNTEENMTGIKWALNEVIDLLNIMALRAEKGLTFAQAKLIMDAVKETEKLAYKTLESRKNMDEFLSGFGKIGGWMKELGKDLWNEMFPKETADEVKTSFEDITKLVEKLKDELSFTEEDQWSILDEMAWDEEIKKQAAIALENIRKHQEEITAIELEESDKRRKIDEDEADEKKKKEDKDADEKAAKRKEATDQAVRAIGVITDAFESSKQRELSAVGDNAKKREAIELKYRRRQKVMSIASAIIDGAEAFQKAQKAVPPPANIPFMIASAAITATQVGLIASQKFAKGAIDIDGPSHSRGGIDAEIEGGESVINKKSTSKYKNLLEAINQDDQMRIMDAMSRDRKITINGGSDIWSRKLYELMKSRPAYGEDNDFYYKDMGNTIITTRKN